MSSGNSLAQGHDSRRIRKVLLTGALGNVGRRVVGDLRREFEIFRTDLAPASPGETDYNAGDLTDFRTVVGLLEGMDAVIHNAAAVPPEDPLTSLSPDEPDPDDQRLLRVNPVSTYNILEAARRLGLVRVVYVSSLTIHLGDRHRKRYGSETPVCPTNLYACTKLFGEQLAEVYFRNHGLSTICLRLGQPVPIGHRFDMVWSGNRRARSTLVHIRDVGRGFSAALRTGCPFGVFNLVSPNDNPRVDWEETKRAIGYDPVAYCSEDGFTFHPDGDFPSSHGRIVTHNPGE